MSDLVDLNEVLERMKNGKVTISFRSQTGERVFRAGRSQRVSCAICDYFRKNPVEKIDWFREGF